MRLVHWSADIVTEVHGKWQVNHTFKPMGFWVSDESRGMESWRRWARDNGFRRYAFRYEYEVMLSPKAKILYLRNHEDIDKFSVKYGYDLLEVSHIQRSRPYIDAIDWKRVAKKYHGIVITPYIYSQRLGTNMWYYPWDCASGCIWNARAIESIRMVREHPRHRINLMRGS